MSEGKGAAWWLDGQRLPEAELDRALQFGESLFETMLAIKGRLPLWDYHWRRLQRGCQILEIPCPEKAPLAASIQSAISGSERQVVKLLLTAGPGGRGYARPGTLSPHCYLGYFPAPPPSREGLGVQLCQLRLGRQPMLAGLKHGNRLEQVLARREVARNHADEGLLLDQAGYLIEGVAANLFLVKEGRLLTPCLKQAGVQGVMRDALLDLASQRDVETHVTELRLDDMLSADEVFFCNSLMGIRPVHHLQGEGLNARWDTGLMSRELQSAIEDKGWS